MDLQEVGWGNLDWIDRAQDRDRRLALVNAVMNLRGISWLAENRLASQEARIKYYYNYNYDYHHILV